FAPLESSLGSRTSIFVSPEGQLSLLPFEILPCPDGKYVIEKFSISYLSSGRDLLKFKKRAEPTDWALVMADPDFELSTQESTGRKNGTSIESSIAFVAPEPARGVSSCLDVPFKPLHHSKEEAESISRTLREKAELDVRAYYGGDALEEVLKSMASPPGILHLATHGYFCEDVDLATSKFLENPLLRCGLALAGANRLMDESQKGDSQTEDGVLTAFEASGLNLIGTELVTLSACETGVGEVKSGEGVYGLRRAFQHAGARTILMSLWKVPDKETRELMDHFYKNWLTGQTKMEALRQAALKVLNACRAKYGAAHPQLWGGFVLTGNPN
ncbi:MAG: CHAT domain-containing protein, partial [Desulfobacteraceae bacterium]|nr:CHAT domain-containing protein [Desulfobacteraceae bacterium]